MNVIDLSKLIKENMDVYPGDPEVEIMLVNTHDKDTWELRKITMGTHTGTHVDAYSHMDEDGRSLDQIPIAKFFGEAQVVGPEDVFPHEKGLFFIEKTGMEMLQKILDADPLFVGGNITEELQRSLLKNEIITYTDLINLEKIPRGITFMFFGLPLNIKDGDGSPVRAVAMW